MTSVILTSFEVKKQEHSAIDFVILEPNRLVENILILSYMKSLLAQNSIMNLAI